MASSLLADLGGRIGDATADDGRSVDGEPTRIDELERLLAAAACSPAARAVIDAASSHARRLLPVYGDASACLALAARALCGLVVEQAATSQIVEELVPALARALRVTPEQASLQLLDVTAAEPTFLELPPALAIEAQLLLLALLAPVDGVSLWRREIDKRTACIAHTPGLRPAERTRTLASLTIEGGREGRAGKRTPQLAVPVTRWQRAHAALAATVHGDGEVGLAAMRMTATRLAPLLERQMLLERNATHERSLVEATERRLTRLGYDLHDGPMQELVVLAHDLMVMRRRVDGAVGDGQRLGFAPAFDELHERIVEIDRSLRELAHSLEARSLVEQPLEQLLRREVGSLVERCEIEADLSVDGDVDSLTTSQRLTLFRVVQEALTNVREHSGASRVAVSVRSDRGSITAKVVDDGNGFDVAASLVSAARRGRLGLVGIHERVRLLGGTFEVESRPGGPTRLTLTLPHWRPLGAAEGIRAAENA